MRSAASVRLRNGEVRKFAVESVHADFALVFYAGHGAQVHGQNYLLPIDIDVPNAETDIQFAGLKVDDLVNGLGDTTQPISLRLDRNGDGRIDAVIFDFKRRGKWDLSFWDEDFSGHWTLVGYHDDGSVEPSRFESYAHLSETVGQAVIVTASFQFQAYPKVRRGAEPLHETHQANG